jgi:plastocyanin
VVLRRILAACGFALAVSSCSGGAANGGITTPSPASTVTIRITSSGFNPASTSVPVGTRVTFTNADTRDYSIASLPVTTHVDCTAINDVGVIRPGESKVTGVFLEARLCRYEDVFTEGGQLLTGQITVQ